MNRPVLNRSAIAAVLALAAGQPAEASFLSGEALDKAADIVAIIVLIVVPVVVIGLFWLVHILPEKVAEDRHHPQKDAVKVLCLLSLVFGGLLWPLAWILAYSRPVLYKMAYGRDRHDDFYKELAAADAPEAERLGDDLSRLRTELDLLASRGALPQELMEMRERLVAVETRLPPNHASHAAGSEGAR